MYSLWDADRGVLLARVETVQDAVALGEWLAGAVEPGAVLCLEVRAPGGRVVAWR